MSDFYFRLRVGTCPRAHERGEGVDEKVRSFRFPNPLLPLPLFALPPLELEDTDLVSTRRKLTILKPWDQEAAVGCAESQDLKVGDYARAKSYVCAVGTKCACMCTNSTRASVLFRV